MKRQGISGVRSLFWKGAFMMAAMWLLVIALPAAGQTQQGGWTRLTIKSDVLGEERTILVRTPQGYEAGNARYPVLYMTDGDAHMAHTSGTIEFLARNGRMPELIVVGITNTDRTRDLTPTNATMPRPDGSPVQFPTSGGADRFLKFIETELVPHIDKLYRTHPYRIFAGHSLGGLFAIHAMLSRPDLFQALIAVSPSLQWDNQVLVKRAEEFFKARNQFDRTLYVTLGNESGPIAEGYKKFNDLLAAIRPKGLEWEAQRMEDEDHGTVVLRSHYFGLRKVFDGWQIARDPQTGAVIGELKGAEEHYRKLSQRFSYTILVPELLINQIGYQILNAGKNQEAIAVFKSNIERYPGSANVY
ncbi:MAG TPA: alpha/beta hydrolase-fold protein, partial [Blastocatellia bacterium]|nr:alpha/beta hydrolase-fold protein [Blastocatellia bacterium]